jgi:hypothetical protein
MITVSELIKILENENQNSIVLVKGYEYGFEYLRIKNIESGKFNLPINEDGEINDDSDLDDYGGNINKFGEKNFGEFGELNYLLIGRE